MDSYKIFKQLEEREKRKNPYKFYDKDELIDTIIELENNIEVLQSKIDKAIKYLKSNEWGKDYKLSYCRTHLLNILKGEDK